MRERDSQKRRVYESEFFLRTSNVSKYAQHLDGTITGCQKYIDSITSHAWFRRRWGTRHIEVKPGKGARGGYGEMRLAKWARNEGVMLHELAHNLVSSQYAAHGPEFAGVYQFLVKQVMGKEYGDKLRATYKSNRVRMNRKALPKPEREVESMAKLAANKRQAKREPLDLFETAQLKRLLNRAINAGQVGEVGTKQRNYARAIVRGL